MNSKALIYIEIENKLRFYKQQKMKNMFFAEIIFV